MSGIDDELSRMVGLSGGAAREASDVEVRLMALGMAIGSHGPAAGVQSDRCFTGRAKHFERYLRGDLGVSEAGMDDPRDGIPTAAESGTGQAAVSFRSVASGIFTLMTLIVCVVAMVVILVELFRWAVR